MPGTRSRATASGRGGRLSSVIRNELRLLSRERSLWWAAALFVALLAYALHHGIAETRARTDAQVAFIANDAATRAAQLERLRRIVGALEAATPFGNPANPEHMGGGYGAQHAWMPAAPLSPVALGQTDLFPSQFKVGYESRVSFLQNDDIENPWNLLAGHFDLAFVIVYLLPLLIFAVSYNLLSAERESGTLRLLLSQPLALRTLIVGKVGTRAGVLLAMAIGLPAVALTVVRPTETLAAGPAAIGWLATVGAYAAFWFALVVAVNAFGRSSATNAMLSIVGWVALVLVAPVLLNLAVVKISPSPSRTELAARIRVVTADAMAANAALLATDYSHVGKPEQLLPHDGRIALSGRSLANYAIERQVDDRIEPELARFDAQQERQQALVSRYSIVSPAAVAYQAMTGLAGNGEARHAHFMRQVADHHRRWKAFFSPRIEAGQALAPDDFASIPTYVWHDEDPAAAIRLAWRSVVQLVVPTLVLVAIAVWRLRRYRAA